MILLVLAAGMGSRYGGLKQIDPIGPNGEIIIDYSVQDATKAGFSKIVFLIRKEIEKDFRDTVGSKFDGKIKVEYAFQELNMLPEGYKVPEGRTKPWGTGHAIICAANHIDEPFVVINADDFYGQEAFRTIANYLRNNGNNNMSMVGYRVENTLSDFGGVSRGVCNFDENGYLIDVTETHNIERYREKVGYPDENGNIIDLNHDIYVSMNFWGFSPEILNDYKRYFNEFLAERGNELKSEFYIPTVVNNLINSGKSKCKVLKCNSEWFGVTYKEDKPIVQAAVRALSKQYN